jgi:polysaccharide pyruvyl transferase CsaB
MGQLRAVLCGYYGKGNGGDEALLASLLQMLPTHVKPLVLSGNPAQTQQRYGVEAIERMSLPAVWKALRQADALIWGGGSLMQDSTSALSPLYYGGLMGLAQKFNLTTIAWAQGIGPLKRRLTSQVTQRAYAGCTAVSVRDRGSAALLSDWHISSVMAPDPVWALAANPVEELAHLPTPRVAVALRSHPLLTPERLAHLTRALIDFQTATQTCLLLVPFQPAQDLAIAEAIQPQLPEISHIISSEDPRTLKGVFQGVEMAIAMRYHGLIMAAAEGCRCFALSYDPKVSQLMHDLELPGWDLAGSSSATGLPEDPAAITQAWLNCYTHNQPLSPDQIQSLVDRALMHRDLLRECLKLG